MVCNRVRWSGCHRLDVSICKLTEGSRIVIDSLTFTSVKNPTCQERLRLQYVNGKVIELLYAKLSQYCFNSIHFKGSLYTFKNTLYKY